MFPAYLTAICVSGSSPAMRLSCGTHLEQSHFTMSDGNGLWRSNFEGTWIVYKNISPFSLIKNLYGEIHKLFSSSLVLISLLTSDYFTLVMGESCAVMGKIIQFWYWTIFLFYCTCTLLFWKRLRCHCHQVQYKIIQILVFLRPISKHRLLYLSTLSQTVCYYIILSIN